MTISSFEIADSDVDAARAWLDRRALDIDGDPNAITWKDHIIASVVAMAKPAKRGKKKSLPCDICDEAPCAPGTKCKHKKE